MILFFPSKYFLHFGISMLVCFLQVVLNLSPLSFLTFFSLQRLLFFSFCTLTVHVLGHLSSSQLLHASSVESFVTILVYYLHERQSRHAFDPWTSLICVSSPKGVYMCVKRCPSQTPNAFICVSPNAFRCVSPNAFICVSPNAFICVSPNAFTCVSPNASAESATELASLAYLCSLRSHVF